MVKFIILSSFIWTFSLIFYSLFLRKEKYFTYNRYYLLFTLVLGIIIPLLPQYEIIKKSANSIINVELSQITFTPQSYLLDSNDEFNFYYIIIAIYILGIAFTSIKFIKALIILKRQLNRSEIITKNLYKIVKTEDSIISFSFFNYIFINKDLYGKGAIDEIMMHELVHIKQKHSYDIIFLEILKIIFWFNPVIYLYRYYLSETHEFIADNTVIQKTQKKTYSELLIDQLQSGTQYQFANYFINSLIKNRIKMMYKTKSNRKWKYLIVFPIFIFLLIFVNACQNNDKENITANGNITEMQNDKPYQIVEEMPRFPGCEDKGTKEDKVKCANENLMKHLYSHLEYPEEARTKEIEGRVVVRFVITKTGDIKDIKILRDIGAGCGDAVIKAVETMNDMEEKFIPGRQNGEKVDVYYTLPVVFKLAD